MVAVAVRPSEATRSRGGDMARIYVSSTYGDLKEHREKVSSLPCGRCLKRLQRYASSWQGKRLTRIKQILAGPEYRRSTAARDIRERIDEFEASQSMVGRDLNSDQAGKGQH